MYGQLMNCSGLLCEGCDRYASVQAHIAHRCLDASNGAAHMTNGAEYHQFPAHAGVKHQTGPLSCIQTQTCGRWMLDGDSGYTQLWWCALRSQTHRWCFQSAAGCSEESQRCRLLRTRCVLLVLPGHPSWSLAYVNAGIQGTRWKSPPQVCQSHYGFTLPPLCR